MRSTSLPLLLLPCLFASSVAPAQTKPKPKDVVEVTPREWEHESSDLVVDPKFNFGSLKNGMRFVWVNNRNPPKQIFMRLHVDIGSLVQLQRKPGFQVVYLRCQPLTSWKRTLKRGIVEETAAYDESYMSALFARLGLKVG